jgi:hypothetical protein
MNGTMFAQSIIRTAAFTYRRAVNRLTADELRTSPLHGISMAWVLLHLTGQLEWAVRMTRSQQTVSIHDVDLLEQFKGMVSESDAAIAIANSPDNGEIVRMFEESVDRALSVLDFIESEWTDPPADSNAVKAFPSVAAVWKHVAFHMSWHLGQLSVVYPQLLGTKYSEPPLHGYTGSLR